MFSRVREAENDAIEHGVPGIWRFSLELLLFRRWNSVCRGCTNTAGRMEGIDTRSNILGTANMAFRGQTADTPWCPGWRNESQQAWARNRDACSSCGWEWRAQQGLEFGRSRPKEICPPISMYLSSTCLTIQYLTSHPPPPIVTNHLNRPRENRPLPIHPSQRRVRRVRVRPREVVTRLSNRAHWIDKLRRRSGR